MQPLVSIIIPTYNRCEILGQTLDSILNQTYTIWECLVIDDCSSDYTEELVNCYIKNDGRIKYRVRPPGRKKGANSCRNYGFEISKGKLINWFDSDDIMKYNFLERKVLALKSKDKVCSISAFQAFSIIDNKIFWGSISKIGEMNILENLIIKNYALPTNAFLWKRSYLTGKELFDEELVISQDLDFHVRIFPADSQISTIKEPLYYLRKGHSNITSKFYSSIEVNFDSYHEVRKRILNKYSSNRTIKYAIIADLMGMFRYLLAIKNYRNSKIILDLVNRENNFGIRSYFRLRRIYLLFFLIKFSGRGETRLKSFFYI